MSVGEAIKQDVRSYGSMSEASEDIANGEDEVGRIVRPIKTADDRLEMEQYVCNHIRTSKYTILTFLPKNMFEQFHRFANFYFLLIVVLNFIPQINAFGKEVAMLPILFVLSVTALKDIFEDRRRYVSDREVNDRECQVFSGSEKCYTSKAWKDVQVGDIVNLECDEIIPADLLLLWSSEASNVCYIETANIDGESNLKQRRCPKGFRNPSGQLDPLELDVEVHCQEPDNKIYHFDGYAILNDGTRVPLDSNNLLLRGCVLRNTGSVIGLVVYAGHDTKAMKNNSGPQYKRSKLERAMNFDVVWCMVILLVLCVTGAIGNTVWLIGNDYKHVIYLGWTSDDHEASLDGFLRFWTYVIVLQIIIPISLYVSVEIVKLGQVFFMQLDIEMYHPDTDTPMRCQALNISEDLGQIQYIFSDKTGTLTENKMVFRKCSILGTVYGDTALLAEVDGQSTDESLPVNRKADSSDKIVIDDSLKEQLSEPSDATDSPHHLSSEQEFMVLMATCNTVVVAERPRRSQSDVCDSDFTDSTASPERGRLGIVYEAESPDEASLVNAAKAYGVTLQSRTPDTLTVNVPGLGPLEYKLLHMLAFTSERKRMSVIVQDPVTQEVILFCKGADSVMYNILRPDAFKPPSKSERKSKHQRRKSTDALAEITQRHLDGFARTGLRTLCMAKRVIDRKEYEQWLKQREAAEQALSNREALLEESACAIERDLELLGATGIEDRLQDGVSQTIQSLREAGIVIWVLTGDKQETAINVAFACLLFDSRMEIIKLNATTKEECRELLDIRRKELKSQLPTSNGRVPNGVRESSDHRDVQHEMTELLRVGLVIDGQTLEFALEDDLKDAFLEIAKICQSVICCRSAPIQKAAVVHLVKESEKALCLAVGDGANDVSMIQMADVGVGIAGNEGMQAVRASDFKLGRFKFLKRLLLVHGHWCYDRLANMILFFFYKNAVFVFLLFWYQIYNGWSSIVPVEQFFLYLYNLVFTALPPMVAGIADQDISDDILMRSPKLYSQGRNAKTYTRLLFWLNIIDAVWQSLVMFYVSFLAYYDGDVGRLEFGTTQNTACVLTVLLHLAVEMHFWTWVHHFTIWGSLVVYFAWALFYHGLFQYPGKDNAYWVMEHTITTGRFWFCIILTPAIALVPRILAHVIREVYFPTPVQMARQVSGAVAPLDHIAAVHDDPLELPALQPSSTIL